MAEDDAVLADPLEHREGKGALDFGVRAVRNGLLTAEQLDEIRLHQQASANLGQNLTIKQIVLDRKLMTEDQVARVERTQQQLTQDRERKQDLKFKGYEIISTLGEGGLGSVFKARQVSMNRLVALKVLHLQWLNDDEFRKRFVLEARIVGKLSHQNLIQVYDVGREGDYYYFSMEFVDGRTAEDLIQEAPRRQLEISRAVDIAIQMVRAINYYRDFDIVHRDIKPSNIMITRSGLVKLGDFGFVKSKLDKELGFEGMVLGTPDYIAPEQALGKEDVDYRADVYSLGASLYHMLTGRPMFNGTPSRVMLAHTRDPMPDPRVYRPSLPEDVSEVLRRMLAKDPNQRYSNLSSLFVDLEALRDAHKPKAPSKYEIGKSSIMRALNIEKSRLAEMGDRIKALEGQLGGARSMVRMAWGAAAGALVLAVLFLVLWLAL
ncbi:MAG: serine/threonine protein kinase [Planctomycetes bacterium]|nr:serine/threonine protein kinase [Planctomycetota bacterium]